MKNTYILYGSYASYYTAKTRSYLRKKGIPFVERLPSDPTFRETVRPTSGSHRIPQLMTPEGVVLQDSVAIQDHLEKQFPRLPATPKTPKQRIFVHLMELMGSEGLLRLAWLHRWMFAENFAFIKKDFGRSFKPQGSDADLQKYGDLIADRMMSYRLPESSPAAREALDAKYKQLLALFEAHLTRHPYFLGGHPSAADYAVMGAFHAHMGRDPAGLRVMQGHAPRVLRWVENMLLPDIQAPEFYAVPIEYLANDEVPDTALTLLRFIADEYGKKFVVGAIGFNQAMKKLNPQTGYALAPEKDQPSLPAELVSYEGMASEHRSDLYAVWLTQRSQHYFQFLDSADQVEVLQMLGSGTVTDLLGVPLTTKISRVDNRFVVA